MASRRLLLDIGNTRIKWAITGGDVLVPGEPIPTRPHSLDARLTSAWRTLDRPGQVWMACVAGSGVAVAVESWLRQQWDCPLYHARTTPEALGVVNAYTEPARLGVDRWLSLIAARRLCLQPVCVAGCGTALTLDTLDGLGRHQGGIISPGLRLMHQALTRGAEQLRHIPQPADMTAPLMMPLEGCLATNTQEAMMAGCVEACLGLIERVYARFARCHDGNGEGSRLILTGGDAGLLARHLTLPCQVEPDLVLKGLQWLAESVADSC